MAQFTPPPISSFQGWQPPDSSFTPPPVSSFQGFGDQPPDHPSVAPQDKSSQVPQNPTVNPSDDPYGLQAAQTYGQQQGLTSEDIQPPPETERMFNVLSKWSTEPIGG